MVYISPTKRNVMSISKSQVLDSSSPLLARSLNESKSPGQNQLNWTGDYPWYIPKSPQIFQSQDDISGFFATSCDFTISNAWYEIAWTCKTSGRLSKKCLNKNKMRWIRVHIISTFPYVFLHRTEPSNPSSWSLGPRQLAFYRIRLVVRSFEKYT